MDGRSPQRLDKEMIVCIRRYQKKSCFRLSNSLSAKANSDIRKLRVREKITRMRISIKIKHLIIDR